MSVLKTENVTHYFDGLAAVSEFNLNLEPYELVGIIGPNGAGKTTIFNLITGVYKATHGSISFDGTEIVGKTPSMITALGIARTFQIAPNASGIAVSDYTMIGALFGTAAGPRTVAGARAIADSVLETVGLALKGEMPAEHLNLVDRKRMELARVLAMRPSVILLDEIMAGLDSSDIEAVLAIIRELRRTGMAILLIEHVVEAVAKLADRIAVLVLGEIMTVGAPSSVLTDPRVLEAYLGPRFAIRASAYGSDPRAIAGAVE